MSGAFAYLTYVRISYYICLAKGTLDINQSATGSVIFTDWRIIQSFVKVIAQVANTDTLFSASFFIVHITMYRCATHYFVWRPRYGVVHVNCICSYAITTTIPHSNCNQRQHLYPKGWYVRWYYTIGYIVQ